MDSVRKRLTQLEASVTTVLWFAENICSPHGCHNTKHEVSIESWNADHYVPYIEIASFGDKYPKHIAGMDEVNIDLRLRIHPPLRENVRLDRVSPGNMPTRLLLAVQQLLSILGHLPDDRIHRCRPAIFASFEPPFASISSARITIYPNEQRPSGRDYWGVLLKVYEEQQDAAASAELLHDDDDDYSLDDPGYYDDDEDE